MRNAYLLLTWFISLCTLPIGAIAHAQFMLAFNQTNVSCNGANDGSIHVLPINGNGNYSFHWTPNLGNTDSVYNLAPGTYSITVFDSISNGSELVLYQENFEGAHNWTLNVSSGVNDAVNSNVFTVSDAEGGMAVGGCGVASNGNKTLHVFSPNFGSGAMYNAGGICSFGICVTTNKRAESPSFSTVNYSNITLEFDYIANGDGLLDNASVWYQVAGNWYLLTNSIKSNVCGSGQGLWTKYSVNLPATCNNNPAVKIAINWTNNDDGIGTDPSVAINDVKIFTTTNGAPVVQSATATVTITEPNAIINNLTVTACNSYDFGGITLTQPGNYSTVYFAANSCDSTVNLQLTLDSLPVATITPINALSYYATGGASYQWINCENGTAIPNATNQQFTPTQNGAYAVVAYNSTNCFDTSTCITVANVGLTEMDLDNVMIYPNPSNSVLNIKAEELYYIKIIDLLGQELLLQKSNTFVSNIDLEFLRQGIYIVKIISIKDPQRIKAFKFIKN